IRPSFSHVRTSATGTRLRPRSEVTTHPTGYRSYPLPLAPREVLEQGLLARLVLRPRSTRGRHGVVLWSAGSKDNASAGPCAGSRPTCAEGSMREDRAEARGVSNDTAPRRRCRGDQVNTLFEKILRVWSILNIVARTDTPQDSSRQDILAHRRLW